MATTMAEKRIFVFGICLSVFSTIGFLMSGDVYQIANWGIRLLDCFAVFRPSDYVAVLTESSYRSNYSIYVNLITAIWELPMYVLDHAIGGKFDLLVYANWYNVLVLLACFLCLRTIWKIVSMLGASESLRYQILTLFLSSAFLQWGSLAFGQIDLIGALFLILSIRFLLERKYGWMAICAAAAVEFKGLALFIIAPIILLYAGGKLKLLIQIALYGSIVPLFSLFLTTFVFPGYRVMKNSVNNEVFHFFDLLVNVKLMSVSVFLAIFFCLCFVCLYKGYVENVKWQDYVLMPLIALGDVILFMDWHPQWLVIWLFFIVAMILLYDNKIVFHLLYFGMNCAFIVFQCTYSTYIMDGGTMDNNMAVSGVIGNIVALIRGEKVMYKSIAVIINRIVRNARVFGETVLVCCFLLLLGIGLYELKNSKKDKEKERLLVGERILEDRYRKYESLVLLFHFLPLIGLYCISYAFMIFEVLP